MDRIDATSTLLITSVPYPSFDTNIHSIPCCILRTYGQKCYSDLIIFFFGAIQHLRYKFIHFDSFFSGPLWFVYPIVCGGYLRYTQYIYAIHHLVIYCKVTLGFIYTLLAILDISLHSLNSFPLYPSITMPLIPNNSMRSLWLVRYPEYS